MYTQKYIVNIGRRNPAGVLWFVSMLVNLFGLAIAAAVVLPLLIINYKPGASTGIGMVLRRLINDRFGLNPELPYSWSEHPSILFTIVVLVAISAISFGVVSVVSRFYTDRLLKNLEENNTKIVTELGNKIYFSNFYRNLVIIFLFSILYLPTSLGIQSAIFQYQENLWFEHYRTGSPSLSPSMKPLYGSYLTNVDFVLQPLFWLTIACFTLGRRRVRILKIFRLVQSGKCLNCGYNLDPNVPSSFCSECGTDLQKLPAVYENEPAIQRSGCGYGF